MLQLRTVNHFQFEHAHFLWKSHCGCFLKNSSHSSSSSPPRHLLLGCNDGTIDIFDVLVSELRLLRRLKAQSNAAVTAIAVMNVDDEEDEADWFIFSGGDSKQIVKHCLSSAGGEGAVAVASKGLSGFVRSICIVQNSNLADSVVAAGSSSFISLFSADSLTSLWHSDLSSRYAFAMFARGPRIAIAIDHAETVCFCDVDCGNSNSNRSLDEGKNNKKLPVSVRFFDNRICASRRLHHQKFGVSVSPGTGRLAATASGSEIHVTDVSRLLLEQEDEEEEEEEEEERDPSCILTVRGKREQSYLALHFVDELHLVALAGSELHLISLPLGRIISRLETSDHDSGDPNGLSHICGLGGLVALTRRVSMATDLQIVQVVASQ